MAGIDLTKIDNDEVTTQLHALRGLIVTYGEDISSLASDLFEAMDLVLSHVTEKSAELLPVKTRDNFILEINKFKSSIQQFTGSDVELAQRLDNFTNSLSYLSLERAQTISIPNRQPRERQIKQRSITDEANVIKEVKLPDSSIIEADYPILIVGPNGAGKSTLGHKISLKNHNSIWFSAHRHLSVPADIAMQTVEQADQGINTQRSNSRKKHNAYENEISVLLNKLRAEHSKSASDFHKQALEGGDAKPSKTLLMTLWELWGTLFPNRAIVWEDYKITVTSTYSATSNNYQPDSMSGGEKAALYLLLKVMTAPKASLLVVDEPELHLHSILAQQFWTMIEDVRPDCRFIYITHDLQFAASRANPKYIVVNQPDHFEVLEKSELPQDLFLKILGTNTFSLNASKVVFIEGKKTGSPDQRFYKQWFHNEGDSLLVVSVESCESVIKHTIAFNNNGLFKGIDAIGIIDRDYRTDSDIMSLKKQNLHILDLHELESCLCSEEIFLSIYKENDFDKNNNGPAKFKDYLQKLTAALSKDNVLAKHIFERTKVASEQALLGTLNKCNKHTKNGVAHTETAVKEIGRSIDLSSIFEEEKQRCTDALNGSYIDKLKLFDGKMILNLLYREIPGISNADIYVAEALKGLKRYDSSAEDTIGRAVINTLSQYLPPRDL
ncbi:DUF4435 domain-containing protein [Vibrio alginolyticus]|uniref:DUF4435 domain-containing protein n=1 Tax=Vibrio alginolyticus TaxID=663 RepID=UPI001C9C9D6C|nr:AAA family ATPase [Vibrio alginolyticus]MBY7682613.1 AAA family ATPase [Vibrio alginolyticus]